MIKLFIIGCVLFVLFLTPVGATILYWIGTGIILIASALDLIGNLLII